jgi:hypothetical protein
MQLDMFESEIIMNLRQELASLKEQLAKNNRATFREIGIVKKQVKALEFDSEAIKQIQARKKADLIPFFGELLEVTK